MTFTTYATVSLDGMFGKTYVAPDELAADDRAVSAAMAAAADGYDVLDVAKVGSDVILVVAAVRSGS